MDGFLNGFFLDFWWFAPIKGPWAGRWHAELARVAAFGLGLSALTALWMTAATFDLLPVDEANPVMPQTVSGEMGLSPTARATLKGFVQRAYIANKPDGPRSFASVAMACRGTVPE